MNRTFYIVFFFIWSLSVQAAFQQYRTHKVEKGETIYSISKKYNVSENELYRLNPDAKHNLRTNTVLIIPSEDLINTENQIRFKKHRVKRKETLYSISQKYNISIDDIKKYNKELYARSLKKGEKIMIPLGLETITSATTVIENTTGNGSEADKGKHTVQAKETKFGIARKYGITIAELDALNPLVGPTLQIGMVLNVPEETVTDSATLDETNFEFYEVQPKEGFYRLKVKFGLSQEDIVALNPYASEGLKEGMVLKIPKQQNNGTDEKVDIVDLSTAIINSKKRTLAIMLPFQLNKTDNDSIKKNIDLIRENGALRVALDFYSGVLMAAEFAKDKGISVHLEVYDTQGSSSVVSNIIANNDFDNVDAVIGPLLQKNVELAASNLRRSNTPVFSPLSNRDIKISSNLFQTLPSNDMLEKAMLNYLEENAQGKNVIIISDSKRAAQKEALLKAIPGARTLQPRAKGFLYATDIASRIERNTDNWVILESEDPVILSNVIGLLNGMPDEYSIRLFALNKNESYNYHDVSNVHLAKLNFTFPSVNKSYNYKEKNAFLVSYKNKYDVLPNRYAVRGFDVTYDVLLRLASAEDIYQASNGRIETEYIENKFRYVKKLLSGYENRAFYIIKYNENLQFEVVE